MQIFSIIVLLFIGIVLWQQISQSKFFKKKKKRKADNADYTVVKEGDNVVRIKPKKKKKQIDRKDKI